MRKPIKVVIYEADQDEGGYWARVPALPGCVSQGETLEEVKRNIIEAIGAYISVREEMADEESGKVVEEIQV
jgi:predicted RNase H-like HicB family nuclease